LKPYETYQPLDALDYVLRFNLLNENINTVKGETEVQLDASKEVRLQVDAEMLAARRRNAEQNRNIRKATDPSKMW
jgi:hypothetical protein